MKYLLLLIIIFNYSFCFSQENNPNYDAELAGRLQADDYGMKSYILALVSGYKSKIIS